MRHGILAAVLLATASLGAQGQSWDRIRGEVAEVGPAGPHWFLVVRSFDVGIAHLVDGDTGEVEGTLSLSLYTPGLVRDASRNLVHAYGSYYSRLYSGTRTDVVQSFDARTLAVVGEVEIPPKSAGIGHSGMLGLIAGRFLGVWNITPAMSVSIVDVEAGTFVGELSTPGCAGVYPVGSGFLMPCGDGTLQYVALDADGAETSRSRSANFFDVQEDPVFDYAVPTKTGWLFMSFEGKVFEATVGRGGVEVSAPWSIFDDAAEAEHSWRIGGSQPFAYNAETGLLVTLM
ncbi:MAG: amine dehydrogenase large subunit, partial [Pseudomonadales bacterium]|nr:amine dehydrogenase large subunit [Pseudomonadales bacterium]